jgi:hypothetical protein
VSGVTRNWLCPVEHRSCARSCIGDQHGPACAALIQSTNQISQTISRQQAEIGSLKNRNERMSVKLLAFKKQLSALTKIHVIVKRNWLEASRKLSQLGNKK